MSSRIKWYLRQLLPLHYCTGAYSLTEGRAFFVRWRQWFNKPFNIEWKWL